MIQKYTEQNKPSTMPMVDTSRAPAGLEIPQVDMNVFAPALTPTHPLQQVNSHDLPMFKVTDGYTGLVTQEGDTGRAS